MLPDFYPLRGHQRRFGVDIVSYPQKYIYYPAIKPADLVLVACPWSCIRPHCPRKSSVPMSGIQFSNSGDKRGAEHRNLDCWCSDITCGKIRDWVWGEEKTLTVPEFCWSKWHRVIVNRAQASSHLGSVSEFYHSHMTALNSHKKSCVARPKKKTKSVVLQVGGWILGVFPASTRMRYRVAMV